MFYFICAVTAVSKETEIELRRELANFSAYLKHKGMKITHQRLLVAEKIFKMETHFTVDSLAEALRSRKDEISRATIYRIVSLMVEAGQLMEHNFGQNTKYYEHSPGMKHHDHIVCVDCGLIEEFVDPHIEKVQLEIASRHGFHLTEHSLNLYGQCGDLKNTGKCKRRKQIAADPARVQI